MATTRPLREELIGAWELVSYVMRPAAGGDDLYPFGDRPDGLIIYTPDGFMSAQFMRPDRPEFASWFDATDDELRAAASGYIAYSGPFHVDGDGTLTHGVWVSL
jgi:Lipocalin-like domain